ncbi:hypothetical protein L210DRAFT_3561853 [Boletus edulis BED1]|uniref:Uncharacterized protein n=1 Tax=Boletus edulis BED1 TaxID=1328754 RepID=A0AAD4G912_BOLED|nr:hypothetical protein L210DRAFT_3561853 [Boletus edulis BED1]
MGSILQLHNLLLHFTTFFRQFMSQTPPHIPGLFGCLDYQVETCAWPLILRDNASLCQLVCMEFCKAKNDKLHEFLVLYFSHSNPTVTARAVAIVDRTVKDRSQFSALASPSLPSQKVTEALDKVHVMGQGNNLKAYLLETYGEYDTLCVLKYAPSTGSIPSALQISTLLFVVTNYRQNYNLYEYNCYWYAGTIFEACKDLFPGYEEECMRHGDRGKCRLKIPMLATSSLPDVCSEYHVEWEISLQRRSANQELMGHQELKERLDKERRAHEGAQRAWEQRLKETQQEWGRQLEEAQQEWGRQLEEAQRCCEQLQAELQAVRQIPQHTPAGR